MFNSAFNEIGATSQNYYPDDLRNEIDNINVLVKKAEGKKCPRCWKIFVGPCVRCEAHN